MRNKVIQKALDVLYNIKRVLAYAKRNGIKAAYVRVSNTVKIRRMYRGYGKKAMVSEADINEQRNRCFDHPVLFSVIVPLYRTPEEFLRAMIESVLAQSYSGWELCLSDGSEDGSLDEVLSEYCRKDGRIKVKKLEKNLGIAENTNAAMQMAEGNYIVLLDHDDLLTPNALYECMDFLDRKPETDLIYSDEDKTDETGKKFFEPNYKPDFNEDYLASINYICHLFVFRRSLYEKFGGFRAEFDGAQDHDLVLRYSENTEHIGHIPKILYHWRVHSASTAADPGAKLYAFENGAKAVTEHYKRLGIPAKAEIAEVYGLYKCNYDWDKKPLVSIVVPNKDHAEDLARCIESVEKKSAYRNFEWIIAENNSTEKETFALYRKLKNAGASILKYEGEFNYSAINNRAAKRARGEFILFLNNDTELLRPESLERMVNVLLRKDVGAVGARLLYPDDTIQHAGVVLGAGGIAGHAFTGFAGDDPGYMCRILATQELSAVTAACLLIKKSVFEEIGGFDEKLKVAFNDVDLCMKVRKKGYKVVYEAGAVWRHYESKSRGEDREGRKMDRFHSEIIRFGSRWKKEISAGDPFYNPNLSLDEVYTLKKI